MNKLFNLIEIKILCIEYNVEQFEFSRKGVVIGFYKNEPQNPEKLLDLSMNRNSQFTLRRPASAAVKRDSASFN